MTPVINVNLQLGVGGGEVYTRSFLAALETNGIVASLVAHPDNAAWERLAPTTPRLAARAADELPALLAAQAPAWLVFHTPPGPEIVRALQAQGHYVSCFAHMPLHGRDPRPLAAYDAIFPVSGYVLSTLLAAGLTQAYREPLYGIADLGARAAGDGRPLVAASVYDWDKRKVRERVASWLAPLLEPLRRRPQFAPSGRIALGIVSRLTPIKQFPQQFAVLGPVLARHPQFQLEIFGAGGYASVRDLRRALAPAADRVRWWGHQRDVRRAYGHLDYLLTGLPEKEALGLNVLEAQACGVPVLAVDAPPFTETVAAEVSGLFYTDPRRDGGAAFSALLDRLAATPFRIDPERARPHLERFGAAAFAARVATLARWVESQRRPA